MPLSSASNHLLFGDNLVMLRGHVADESVDLVYLDPPFNSNRNYNVLFRDESGLESEAQINAFEDTWHWDQKAQSTFYEVVKEGPDGVGRMIEALHRALGANQMTAYLVMMAARLVELHRVLKPTGSLYLHCDPTASHYLKIILDTIFGPERFINEVIWKRSHAHNSGNMLGPIHDTILSYSKGSRYTWNTQYRPFDESYIASHYKYVEDGRRYKRQDVTGAGVRHGATGQPWRGVDPTPKGRHWMRPPAELDKLDAAGRIYWPDKPGAWPYLKLYLDERLGMPLQDIWDDINPINPVAKERLGYPTQKPLALLERIIEASSNPGDIVLDPFCGCGTAIAAAQTLGRRWIGIDVTFLAVALQRYRLEQMYPGVQFSITGQPEDLGDARRLAQENRYQFQWWALFLVHAKPLHGEVGGKGKKGADRGVDGVINFIDGNSGKPERVLVQVKSGHVSSRDLRDLRGAVEREGAAMGVFVTLEPPTREMTTEAASAGYYEPTWWGAQYPRLQILTIDELLHGTKRVEMPPEYGTFKRAQRSRAEDDIQMQLGL